MNKLITMKNLAAVDRLLRKSIWGSTVQTKRKAKQSSVVKEEREEELYKLVVMLNKLGMIRLTISDGK